jgi:hypothetical protein
MENKSMDDNGYQRVGFLDIYTLFIIHWVKNLDIYKLSIKVRVFIIYYYLLINKKIK